MKRILLTVSTAALLCLAPAVSSQPFGMGPGMMGGYGMGPGMMGGYGMGPGMMGGYGDCQHGRNLSAEQQKKIAEIQRELGQKRWQLMGEMHQQSGSMYQLFGPGPTDEKAARRAYEAMAEIHKQMFEASLQARKRIEAVLTPDPSEQTAGGSR